MLAQWLSGMLSRYDLDEKKKSADNEDPMPTMLPLSVIVGEIGSYLDRESNLRLMSASKEIQQEVHRVGLPWPIHSEWKIHTDRCWLLGEVILACSHDKILCGAQDGTLRCWNRSGKLNKVKNAHDSGFLAVVALPARSRAVTVARKPES